LESYNPHVRYGAAFAVGISCAGTGLGEAISLPEPLTSDAVARFCPSRRSYCDGNGHGPDEWKH